MGVLRGTKTYLAGAIDRVIDDGVTWRRDVIRKCNTENGMGILFLDPTNKPKPLASECGVEKIKVEQLKKDGKYEEAAEYVKQFRRYDLRMIDFSDFFTLYVDVDCHLCGSYFETNVASLQRKPIFAIIKQGKEHCPSWLLSYLEHDEIFGSVDDYVEHLRKIDTGEIALDSRWVILRIEDLEAAQNNI